MNFLLYVMYCFVHFGLIISVVTSFCFLLSGCRLVVGLVMWVVVSLLLVLCFFGFGDTTVCDCHVCLGEPFSFNLFLLSPLPLDLLFPHQ